ncbi:alcohol dehydrogenase 1-like isoform X2 [Cryptomeria japonica]|uniref:alcohol dehydrogenase 1-like isoform X2 n=1 Tax=Cryptomeria japonica TaxID=3369 RepID=UPI0027DA710B|nr:alcohol dehydrogenase 1-like isoform X2 [Cryptomeria japonica]
MFKKNQGHVPIFPRIFGHEATRIIQSVGEDVIDLREDDCVLTFFTGECKECMHSKSDKRNMSETLRMVRKGVMRSDQKTHFSVNGKPISHFCVVSSFSEYAVVHSGYIVKLSSYVPFGKICVLGCGIATDVLESVNEYIDDAEMMDEMTTRSCCELKHRPGHTED